jgi:hypothetical protein
MISRVRWVLQPGGMAMGKYEYVNMLDMFMVEPLGLRAVAQSKHVFQMLYYQY